jgi:hypothetical protein
MSGAFGLAGWHFSSNPTSSSSENKIGKADNTEPWKTGRDAAYQYHPHGDTNKPRKDAPSALNEVIIPNVNLPKVSSFGRRGGSIGVGKVVLGLGEGWDWVHEHELLTFDCSRFTRSTTSGARRASKRLVFRRASCVNIKSFEDRNRAIFFVSPPGRIRLRPLSNGSRCLENMYFV